ncbi:hypothetical protein PR202_gb27391 [Eleusine coracana subsp. coracana]|uniref:Holocarboxylase synthetase n=1 Tax=Eleusine coracana subsp. coracana TaxID=191504 RepID=A0AAV5FVX4_ELECO|nr:hypothetical protein QOZ80_4BG0359560 [Eleusine coracana subsp. coracana]GJN38356.1 hypothetical protein PR202_gb27391 [Eleusine coracana subsp. coracana]
MARKRKTDAAPRLDEADRTLYSTFCSAANSLSQLYSQATVQQKQSFHAGELHALEKLHQWIVRKYEEESRLTVADIMTHIQHEMDYGGSDANVGTRGPPYPQVAGQFGNSNSQFSAAGASAPRALNSEQPKGTSIFSNALTSPVRRSLQNYHPATQGQGAANDVRNTNESNSGAQNGDTNSGASSDTTMEMVSDSPANEFL